MIPIIINIFMIRKIIMKQALQTADIDL